MKKIIRRQMISILLVFAMLFSMQSVTALNMESGFGPEKVAAASAAALPDSYNFYTEGSYIKCDFVYNTDRKSGQSLQIESANSPDGPWHEEVLGYTNYWSAGQTKTLSFYLTEPGKTYYVRLKAVNDNDYYNPVTVFSEPVMLTFNKKLSAPEWIQTYSKAYVKSCRLTWKLNYEAEKYLVYRSAKKNSGYKKIATVNVDWLNPYTNVQTQWMTYYDTSVKAGTAYYYKLIPVCAGTKGEKSTWIKLKTKKANSVSNTVYLPSFESYTGIAPDSKTTKTSDYGVKANVVKYSGVTRSMYDGYIKLLESSHYPFQSIYGSDGYKFFDYTGTKSIKRGSVDSILINYATCDLCVSWGNSGTVSLTYSTSLKQKNVAKNLRYDSSTAGSDESSSNSGGGGSSSSDKKTRCTACNGNGKVDCKKCTDGFKMCPSCNGTGTYYSYAEQRIVNCNRTGCSAGKIKCSSCKGKGTVDCSICDGNGWKSANIAKISMKLWNTDIITLTVTHLLYEVCYYEPRAFR
ncbi:MAG: hypothetical protein NC180_11035 [Muribaculaceae bacterium]|nr:hypothetical protein [Roseburia sp.]MCM1431999.1 hypothetical protein [Muribaculaceae bacterium]MCM1493747.1 hypothetical protein [Muribaculaceae bacterium]